MWTGSGAPDRRQSLFGGEGEVRVWSLLEAPFGAFDCVLGCELDVGGSVGAHVQDRCDEVVIVTEGEGEARVGDRIVRLSPGVVLPVTLGVALQLNNRGGTVLRYLIVKTAGR
jgi:mannose-6-phosphate isomerase-like protein (cupin superfamily)